MTSDTEKTQGAMAALNALNKISDSEFKSMQSIQQQFAWTTYYFPSDEMLTPTINMLYRLNDPRNKYDANPSDTIFIDFASRFHVPYKFVYMNDDGKPNASDMTKAADEIAQRITNGKVQEDVGYISQLIAGIRYLNKSKQFETYMRQVMNTTSEALNTVYSQCGSGIEKYTQMLERFFQFSSEQIKKENLYIVCESCSYASSDLKSQYESIKKRYNQLLTELLDIVKSSSQLTLCYNLANTGDTVVDGDDNAVKTNVNQIINCAGDMIADEYVSGSQAYDDAILQQLQQLKSNSMTRTEIAKKIDDKMTEHISGESRKIHVGAGLIIALIVLMIICICALMVSIRNAVNISHINGTNSSHVSRESTADCVNGACRYM